MERARERLKFDELFTLELGVAFRKHRVSRQQAGRAHHPATELVGRFVAALPFELTKGQENAIAEIREAMARPHPMNVLLQGDVGSGKTVVAVAACLVAVDSGHQAAIMAPTEVLAGQHARSVAALLAPIGGRTLAAAQAAASGDDAQGSLLEVDPAPEEPGGPVFATLTALFNSCPATIWSPVSFIKRPEEWLRAFLDSGATISAGAGPA